MPSICYNVVFACFVMPIFSPSSLRSKLLQSFFRFVPDFMKYFSVSVESIHITAATSCCMILSRETFVVVGVVLYVNQSFLVVLLSFLQLALEVLAVFFI